MDLLSFHAGTTKIVFELWMLSPHSHFILIRYRSPDGNAFLRRFMLPSRMANSSGVLMTDDLAQLICALYEFDVKNSPWIIEWSVLHLRVQSSAGRINKASKMRRFNWCDADWQEIDADKLMELVGWGNETIRWPWFSRKNTKPHREHGLNRLQERNDRNPINTDCHVDLGTKSRILNTGRLILRNRLIIERMLMSHDCFTLDGTVSCSSNLWLRIAKSVFILYSHPETEEQRPVHKFDENWATK